MTYAYVRTLVDNGKWKLTPLFGLFLVDIGDPVTRHALNKSFISSHI